jgi:hypothetical protein
MCEREKLRFKQCQNASKWCILAQWNISVLSISTLMLYPAIHLIQRKNKLIACPLPRVSKRHVRDRCVLGDVALQSLNLTLPNPSECLSMTLFCLLRTSFYYQNCHSHAMCKQIQNPEINREQRLTRVCDAGWEWDMKSSSLAVSSITLHYSPFKNKCLSCSCVSGTSLKNISIGYMSVD